jgi:hypothetical protein
MPVYFRVQVHGNFPGRFRVSASEQGQYKADTKPDRNRILVCICVGIFWSQHVCV